MSLQIYFGTVVRTAAVAQGGELVRLDWDTRTIERRVPVMPRDPSVEHDPNPRGNTRGCRGIQLQDGRVLAANYHTVDVFDRELNHLHSISDGLMVGLHETWLDRQLLWVTSTAIDAAVCYDMSTGERKDVLLPRRSGHLRNELDLDEQRLDLEADHRLNFLDSSHTQLKSHLHLNAIAGWDGRHYALLHAKGAIVDLSRERIVYRDPHLKKAHNLVMLGDGRAVVNDTYRATLRIIDLEQGQLLRSISIRAFPRVQWLLARSMLGTALRIARSFGRSASPQVARPLFLRGLAIHGNDAFVGISPATILQIDLESGRLKDWFEYSSDVRVCVHGLAVAPESSNEPGPGQ